MLGRSAARLSSRLVKGLSTTSARMSTRAGPANVRTAGSSGSWRWGRILGGAALAGGSVAVAATGLDWAKNTASQLSLLPAVEAKAASTPQPTPLADSPILTYGAFVIIHLAPGADVKAVGRALAGVPGIVKDTLTNADEVVGIEVSADDPPVMASVCVSDKLWAALTGSKAGVGPYKTRSYKGGQMPATGGDVLIHVKGASKTLCFEVVRQLHESLPSGSIHAFQDFHGFKYQDNRDLSGFIDGTANPGGAEARAKVAIVADGPNAGGSYVMAQVWEHDFKKIASSDAETLESYVGREQPGGGLKSPLPINSHVQALRNGNPEGPKKIEMVRHSMPFGSVGGNHGLFFIGYANSTGNFDFLLDRMAQAPDGLFNISKAVTGQYFYVPTKEQLSALA